MTAVSYTAINEAIKAAGGKERLVFGFGRYYFTDGNSHNFAVNTVRVPSLDSFTVDEWVRQWDYLRSNLRQGRGTPPAQRAIGS